MQSVYAILEGRQLSFESKVEVDTPRRVLVTFLDESGNGAFDEESVEQKFERFFRQWHDETAPFSGSVIFGNPNYLKMIGLGKPAIPLILNKLREKPYFVFSALESITGENPVPEAHHGKPGLIAEDWLEWGRQRGLVK